MNASLNVTPAHVGEQSTALQRTAYCVPQRLFTRLNASSDWALRRDPCFHRQREGDTCRTLAGYCATILVLLRVACPSWSAPPSSLRFRKVILPGNSSTLALMQDKQGFVWAGTQGGGLIRYDGYNSVKYVNDSTQPRSLPHNRVNALHEDDQGRIWVGTRAGLARYEPATNTFRRFIPPAGLPNQLDIKAIISDRKGGLWLATWGGIQHLNPATGEFTQYVHNARVKSSLAYNDVNALALDDKGGLWAATWPAGLDYLPAGSDSFHHYRIDSDAAQDSSLNIARALQFDRDQTLWIGTEAGVVTWGRGTKWAARTRLPSPRARVNQFHADRSGNMWVGTISAGIFQFSPKSGVSAYSHRANDPYSLPADNVRAIIVDRTGMLWAGTFTDGIGLANLNTSGITRIIPYAADVGGNQQSNVLPALAHRSDGTMWLGGRNGLSLFDPRSGSVIKNFQTGARSDELSSNLVYSLYQQAGGPLWVGTSDGLCRFDITTQKFKQVRFKRFADRFINSISPGSDNSLWLGTGDAAIRFDTVSGRWRAYRHDPANPYGPSVRGASTILEDHLRRVWIGSEMGGGGLDLLDHKSGRVRNYSRAKGTAPGLASDIVTSLHQDQDRRIWVGTDKGLNQILTASDGSVTFLPTGGEGIGQRRIISVLSDLRGMLWLSTPSGLIEFDPENGVTKRYTETHGVSDSFTVGSAASDAHGDLYFGGMRGMTVVRPGMVRTTPVPPQIAITHVTVLNRSVTEGVKASVWIDGPLASPRSISLSSQDPVFSIEFAALHFADPVANTYQYRLEGFDQDWIPADHLHRSATYTNLAPGQYNFRVRAFNDSGQISPGESALSVVIRPAYWQTLWFRLLAGLSLLLGLAVAYYWHIRRFIMHRARLERLMAARTREIEDANSKLEALAFTDGLTGVHNRRGFDAAIAREWGRAARGASELSVAMVDADFFKRFNDHYGHQAGDRCLRIIAEVLKAKARRPTDVVARYGGEEFVLILPDTGLAHAMAIAKAICAEMAGREVPHAHSEHGVVTVSIGVASAVPGMDADPESLIARADRALYFAKSQGRNQAF